MPNPTNPLSACCQTYMTTQGGIEGTNYYTCNKCHEPCDQYVVTNPNEAETLEKIKILADLLIGTLGDIKPNEADEIVKKVSLIIYNDILGIDGDIQKSGMRLCTVYGTNMITNVRFVPKIRGKIDV